MEYACVAGAGIDNFWTNTLRHNLLLLEHRRISNEHIWDNTRYIAYANYSSTINMDGKSAFKDIRRPTDLFSLRIDDLHKVEYKRDNKKAQAAFNRYKDLTNGSSR